MFVLATICIESITQMLSNNNTEASSCISNASPQPKIHQTPNKLSRRCWSWKKQLKAASWGAQHEFHRILHLTAQQHPTQECSNRKWKQIYDVLHMFERQKWFGFSSQRRQPLNFYSFFQIKIVWKWQNNVLLRVLKITSLQRSYTAEYRPIVTILIHNIQYSIILVYQREWRCWHERSARSRPLPHNTRSLYALLFRK